MYRTPVRQIMQSSVVTIGPDQLAGDAAQLMDQFSIRRLPVVDQEDCLVGLVTDSDVREAETAGSVLSSYEPGAEADWLTVADIMTSDVITIGPDASLGELVVILMERKVGGVPVVEPHPESPKRQLLVGIVTEVDVFAVIAKAWRADMEQAEGNV